MERISEIAKLTGHQLFGLLFGAVIFVMPGFGYLFLTNNTILIEWDLTRMLLACAFYSVPYFIVGLLACSMIPPGDTKYDQLLILFSLGSITGTILFYGSVFLYIILGGIYGSSWALNNIEKILFGTPWGITGVLLCLPWLYNEYMRRKLKKEGAFNLKTITKNKVKSASSKSKARKKN